MLDRPIAEIMSPPMPMIGIGEPVARVGRVPRAGPVGARARRRPPDRRAHPLRRALVPRGAHDDRERHERRATASRPARSTPGQEPDPTTGAIVPPISLATTFAQDAVGKHRGYEYARSGNPTRTALETCVASLEGARHGLAFASGLAAEDAILRTLDPGDHVIIPTDAYGGTFRLVARVHERHGIAWTAVRPRATSTRSTAAWRDETRLVWIETPTNPAARRSSTSRRSPQLAHARDARVVVDNTFATPYLQQPLALGADVVVHSTTKYLGGHSDVVGGFVAVNDAELADELRFLQNAMGAVPSPFDCYLVLRGVKTLARAHGRGTARTRAAIVADARASTTRSRGCSTRACPTTPATTSRARQMRDFGGMVSFLAAGGEDAALDVVARTRLFTLAESLGAVESLIEHPGAHDARVGRRLAARGRPRARAAVGRHRVGRRSRRRPPPGARRGRLSRPRRVARAR